VWCICKKEDAAKASRNVESSVLVFVKIPYQSLLRFPNNDSFVTDDAKRLRPATGRWSYSIYHEIYIIHLPLYILLFVGTEAFASIARRKTSSIAVSPCASPKKWYSIFVTPAVIGKTSSAAAMDIGRSITPVLTNWSNGFYIVGFITSCVAFVAVCVAFVAGVVAVVDFFISIKKSFAELRDGLKADIERGINASEEKIKELKAEFQGLKAEFQGLKTELKAEFQGLKTDVKADVSELKAEFQGLKTELKAEFQGLKTDTSSKIDRVENSFSVKIDAQDKIIEANGIKIEGRLLLHEA
jgi:Skp family chaperone for outer membrane proteins